MLARAKLARVRLARAITRLVRVRLDRASDSQSRNLRFIYCAAVSNLWDVC